MKILLLHAIDDPNTLRRATLNQSFCMYKYAPEHEYILQCYGHPVSDAVRNGSFDAILIDTTFLCYRWIRPRSQLDRLFEEYDFVARSPAVKIAFPQDDYDHSAILDRWLTAWGVKVVFSPLAQFKDLLYPRTSRRALIEPSLTGYVDPIDLKLLAKLAKSRDARGIDVGYRARNLSPVFGRAGRLKSEIGRIFSEKLPPHHGLRLDISARPDDVISGDAWLGFLGDCRFFLGGASGSSLHDPEGLIKDRVDAYLEQHPDASFKEVEAACFPGEDGITRMTALGPRNIEAALARTCQILVTDSGLSPMQPDIHFIPLEAGGGNIKDVIEKMLDTSFVDSCVNAAGELFSSEEWSYSSFVARIQAHLPAPERHANSNIVDGLSSAAREHALKLQLYRASLAGAQERYNRIYTTTEHLYRRVDNLEAEFLVERSNRQRAEAEFLVERSNRQRAEAEFLVERSNRQRADESLRILNERWRRSTGWRGALREILGINDYIDDPQGRARRFPTVLVFRAWHVWRSMGLSAAVRILIAQQVAQLRDRKVARRVKSGDAIAAAGTITMLVPDDRIDRRVLLSARSLQNAGWRVTVIAPPYSGDTDGDQLSFRDVKIVRINTSIPVSPPRLVRAVEYADKEFHKVYFYHNAFLQEALRNPAQVYVAHDLPVLPAALVAAREVGSRLAYDAHELYPEQHHFTPEQVRLFAAAEATLVGEADLVTTVNDSIAQQMASRYSIAFPAVIWNAPEALSNDLPLESKNLLRRALGIGAARRILLFQGGLTLNRNLEDLVRSMARVETEDVILVMMGPGDQKREELKGVADESGLTAERIRFAPPVPQDQLLMFTASADVGIIPYPPIDLNSYYCTPNKLFEYIVAGVPILANDLPELREFVFESGFGQVHRMDGPEKIAQAIDRMFASDLESYRKILARDRKKFIWDEQGRKLAVLYEAAFPDCLFARQVHEGVTRGQCAASQA